MNGLGTKKTNIGNLVRATAFVVLGMGGGYLIRGGNHIPNYHNMNTNQVVAYEKMEYQAMTPDQRDAVRNSYVQQLNGSLLQRVGEFFGTTYNAFKGVVHNNTVDTAKK